MKSALSPSLCLRLSFSVRETYLTSLPTEGDEEPVRRKLPFVEALIQMCTLLSKHHSELSPLLPLSLFSSPNMQPSLTSLLSFPPLFINNLLLSTAEE